MKYLERLLRNATSIEMNDKKTILIPISYETTFSDQFIQFADPPKRRARGVNAVTPQANPVCPS